MKKFILMILPIFMLSACDFGKKYTVGTDAFCVGLEQDSGESVFCKDANGQPLNGMVVQYFADGKIAREITVKNGRENGVEKEYYENGNLKVYAIIKNGFPVETSKLYHKNGQLHMIVKWTDAGARIIKIYDESGNVISSGK